MENENRLDRATRLISVFLLLCMVCGGLVGQAVAQPQPEPQTVGVIVHGANNLGDGIDWVIEKVKQLRAWLEKDHAWVCTIEHPC